MQYLFLLVVPATFGRWVEGDIDWLGKALHAVLGKMLVSLFHSDLISAVIVERLQLMQRGAGRLLGLLAIVSGGIWQPQASVTGMVVLLLLQRLAQTARLLASLVVSTHYNLWLQSQSGTVHAESGG